MLLLDGDRLLVFLILLLLLELLALHILVSLEIGVEDHPLGGLKREV